MRTKQFPATQKLTKVIQDFLLPCDVLAVQSSTVIHIIISYLSFACPFKYSFIRISMEQHFLFPFMVQFFFFSVRFWWLSTAIEEFLFASIAKVKTHTFFVFVGREAHNAAVGSISIEIHGTKVYILWNEWTLPTAQNGNATIFSPGWPLTTQLVSRIHLNMIYSFYCPLQ